MQMFRMLQQGFLFFSSLNLALLILFVLILSLIVATLIESLYDTPTAHYWIYRARWFYGVLVFLGVNVWTVMWSRWPWRWTQLPFLLAHIGILFILFGSWLTDRQGLDGSLTLEEGESSGRVEIDQPLFSISEGSQVRAYPISWQPPQSLLPFQSFSVGQGFGISLTLDQFISRAEARIQFEPVIPTAPSLDVHPALLFRISGGPMKISQEVWLWAGSPRWATQDLGPARFSLMTQRAFSSFEGPQLLFEVVAPGQLKYQAFLGGDPTRKGQAVSKVIPFENIEGTSFLPGWKGEVRIDLVKWITNARVLSHYVPAQQLYGKGAPPSAIRLHTPSSSPLWLSLGDRAQLDLEKRSFQLRYGLRTVFLPFSLRLHRFQVDFDPGTEQPAHYASWVSILGEGGEEKELKISMNEPLSHQGYTFYQTSYEKLDSGKMLSVLTVNQDPGRFWKYLGSFILVLGTFLLCGMKFLRAEKRKREKERGRVL